MMCNNEKKLSRLIIIGNGFDLHHNMETSFLNYRQFLMDNGREDVVKSFEERDISNLALWNILEQEIGTIQYESAYCYLLDYSSNDWHDSCYHDFQYEINHMTKYWPGIRDGLNKWVQNIKYTSPDKKLLDLIKGSNSFLSFNYTNTLEKLYGIPKKKILYIHGDCSKDETLILGHRNGDWFPEWNTEVNDDFRLLEANEIMEKHFQDTKKRIKEIIVQNAAFFNLKDYYDEIYVLGLSYNYTDIDYLKEIAKNNPKAFWFFNWHSDNDELQIDSYAKSLGVNSYKKINIDK